MTPLVDNAPDLPDIGPGWHQALAAELQAPYFSVLHEFVLAERAQHHVCPPTSQVFAAFWATPFADVRVVILGQDPYHGPGQAHGLAFSVPSGIPTPPSLANIFAELNRDLQLPRPSHGDLTTWARQGVFLLNATLTVRAAHAGSHQGHGWERFTDAVIRALNKNHSGLIFLLWGRFAQQKAELIDTDRHSILRAPHPSPLSAYKGFLGCGHFSRTNALLQHQGRPPIQWALP